MHKNWTSQRWTSQDEKEPSLRGQMERGQGGCVQASMLIASSTARKHRPQIPGSASRLLLLLFTPNTQPLFLQHNLYAKEAGLGGVSSHSLPVYRPRWWVTKKSSLVFLFDNLDSSANLPFSFQPLTSTSRCIRMGSTNPAFSLKNWCFCNFRYLHIKNIPCKIPLCFNLGQEATTTIVIIINS